MSGSQGSVQIAKLIDTQQRIRSADNQLDRLLEERNQLAEQYNELDPTKFVCPRSLSDRYAVIVYTS